MNDTARRTDPMTEVLATFRNQEATDFHDAWVGMEPDFETEKSVRKWHKMAARGEEGETAYFNDDYMLRTQKKVAKTIKKRYEAALEQGKPYCMFAGVDVKEDLDQWGVIRQNIRFHWADDHLEPFVVRFALDPEVFEYSIKPVPLAWYYDDRFVKFCDVFLWQVPFDLGMSTAIEQGGAQFSLSAKSFMGGSLLADDIAYKASHPELATLIMDWPNCDNRTFRATRKRLAAFQKIIKHYWAGHFHPKAIGTLTVENAYLDRGFGPACSAPEGVMDPKRGPVGDAREIFQTNFAFGRALRLQAQNVHPGYWQAAHPDSEGYRPDQIMRYSEGNLNRLQIAGELHVKSGKVLNKKAIPELDAPLELALLYNEASWENRAQTGRTSGRDFVEAVLLDVHHAEYLKKHPHVTIPDSVLLDQLLGDAEETLRRHGGTATLDRLRNDARALNLDMSGGRMRTDFIEPETIFWEAWRVLSAGEKAAIARDAIGNFLERVEQAASVDPRPEFAEDPMEWHRHRIHPVLWKALEESPSGGSKDPVNKELKAWQAKKKEYLARRPIWSLAKDSTPPWDEK